MAVTASRAVKPNTPKSTARKSEMELFVWSGTDKRGQKMKGETSAKNANLLKAQLRQQGINPTLVKPKPKPLFGKAGSKITSRDIANFSRQIATMMQSGVPIVTAIEILANGQKNPRMKAMLDDIGAEISGGSPFSDALAKYPVQFDSLFQNLVRAGEGAGVLDTVLDTVASYKERTESLKAKIKKALFYPIAIIAVAVLVSAILLIFVVPQFEATFAGFGADLPAFTRMLVNLSEFMVAYWWMMLLVAIGTFVGLGFAYRRSTALQRLVDRAILKVPVIGNIMHEAAIARFARTLALTFKSGVPLVEALETVAGATGNIVYEDAVLKIRDDIAVGYQMHLAMAQVNLFPHMVTQMVAIGEEAGALDTMLFKVAEFYEEEVENKVDALASLLEPFVMVIIGVLVGSMVIGMYLPIFKLAATV
ncbi:type II secretion system F family protein [Alkalisalibacterium limincola]|uniref:Type II secretion system F family protein n=1 Tax=Alkalisalibacterium limincola TaxID=2699169 RepID=A0A5C8KZS7_9GAMM|nr:type II secretion system F family protein [Alkalisalibacterium limincola]TXK65025.1 type II secretion system F family protein [Alkalisalibacterium limincola]